MKYYPCQLGYALLTLARMPVFTPVIQVAGQTPLTSNLATPPRAFRAVVAAYSLPTRRIFICGLTQKRSLSSPNSETNRV